MQGAVDWKWATKPTSRGTPEAPGQTLNSLTANECVLRLRTTIAARRIANARHARARRSNGDSISDLRLVAAVTAGAWYCEASELIDDVRQRVPETGEHLGPFIVSGIALLGDADTMTPRRLTTEHGTTQANDGEEILAWSSISRPGRSRDGPSMPGCGRAKSHHHHHPSSRDCSDLDHDAVRKYHDSRGRTDAIGRTPPPSSPLSLTPSSCRCCLKSRPRSYVSDDDDNCNGGEEEEFKGIKGCMRVKKALRHVSSGHIHFQKTNPQCCKETNHRRVLGRINCEPQADVTHHTRNPQHST